MRHRQSKQERMSDGRTHLGRSGAQVTPGSESSVPARCSCRCHGHAVARTCTGFPGTAERRSHDHRESAHAGEVRAMTAESAKPPASRRTFLAGTGAAAAAAALLGGPLAGTARAAGPVCPPGQFAPVPTRALGPPVNADGYFVGQIKGDLYWVTDSFYTAMFLTTREGVVLVDAPPTIGHNLLRAISAVTQANGRPSRVTHQVYSHSHADHIGASFLLGPDVVRVGHRLCRELLLRDNDPHRPPPTVTFDDHFVLSVGG